MQGEIIPWPYGYAYHEWDRDVKLYVWIPFNKLVALWMIFMLWLRFRVHDEKIQAAYRAGYRKAYNEAREYVKDLEELRLQNKP